MSEQTKNNFNLIVQAIDAANKNGVYNINESATIYAALKDLGSQLDLGPKALDEEENQDK